MEQRLQPSRNWATADHREIRPACPHVPLHGIPGFHTVNEQGDHAEMASQVMDRDVKGRVNTGTGDQPANTHGSRFGTDCTSD